MTRVELLRDLLLHHDEVAQTALAEARRHGHQGELLDLLMDLDADFYRPLTRLGITRRACFESWWRGCGAPVIESLHLEELGGYE
jgi:hypothetical protein